MKRKPYYTIEIWEKEKQIFDEEKYDFKNRHSGNLPFKTMTDAKKVVAIGGYEHYKIRKNTDSMSGEVVFTSQELLEWMRNQNELAKNLETNRGIRIKLLGSLTKATTGFVVSEIEVESGGNTWVGRIFAEPEAWYNASYSRKLQWSENLMMEFYKNGEPQDAKSRVSIDDFFTRQGIKIKRFKDDMDWKLKMHTEADEEVRALLAEKARQFITVCRSRYTNEFRPMFHHLSEYVLCSRPIGKKDAQIVTELPEAHEKSLKKKLSIMALAKDSEISFAEDNVEYVLKYM